jgi:Tol biopolymer transport system component
MTKRRTLAIFGVVLALSICLTAAADRSREQKYQQAVDLFESKGDVKGAIKLFEEAAKSPDRNLAARSLLYLGSCYEKLGQDGAQKAYERLVRDFSDQSDVTAKARTRLTRFGKPVESGVVARRIWTSSPSDNKTYGSLVSRDGRYLAYLDYGNDSINVKDTVTGEERQVLRKASPKDRTFNWVDVSPDGKRLAYCSSLRGEPTQLHIVGADGSNPRHLGEGVPEDWSPDGKYILASQRQGPNLALVSVADGSSRTIVSGTFHARFSPDGRYIAFIRPELRSELGRFIGSLFVVPANGGPEVLIVDGRNKEAEWAPDGKRLLFVSNRRGSDDLWSVRVAEGKPDGPPEMLREHISGLIGVNRDGDLYYGAGHEISDIYTVEVDPRTGKPASRPKRITTRNINYAPAWSPDGESLAYYSQRGTAGWGQAGLTIVVRNIKTGEEWPVPLKRPISLVPHHPYWFPDGRSIFAQVFRGGGLISIDLQTGEDRPLLTSARILPAPIRREFAALAPDGRAVYYLARDEKSDGVRVLVRNLDGSGERELFRAYHIGVPALSPDGSRLALVAGSERGGAALFTLPAGGGDAKELYRQPESSFLQPVWSRDGKHIFIATAPPKGKPNGEIWSVSVDGGEPQPLEIGLSGPEDLNLHPDGKQLVFTNDEWHDEIWVLKNLLTSTRAAE